MQQEKQYEILDGLPSSGPMHVSIAGNNEGFFSEGFVVRFYRKDNTEWVANIMPGFTSLNKVYQLFDPTLLLVLAGGTGYIIDPNQMKPVSVIGGDYVSVFIASNGRFVLQGTTDITIVETTGTFWHSERISLDGLKDITLTGNIVKGLSYELFNDAINNTHDRWVDFTYDIDTRMLIGGSHHSFF